MARKARPGERVRTVIIAEGKRTRGENGHTAATSGMMLNLRRTGGRGTSKDAGRLFNAVECSHPKQRSAMVCAEPNCFAKYLFNGGELWRIEQIITTGDNGDVLEPCDSCEEWIANLGLTDKVFR